MSDEQALLMGGVACSRLMRTERRRSCSCHFEGMHSRLRQITMCIDSE